LRDGTNRTFGMSVTTRRPCECPLHDVLVREDTFGSAEPIACSCPESLGDVAAATVRDESLCFGAFERDVCLGKGLSALQTPEYARYAELIRNAFQRPDWDSERFDLPEPPAA
jgi:hypothetical protein